LSTHSKFGKNRTKIKDAFNGDENTFMDTLVNNVGIFMVIVGTLVTNVPTYPYVATVASAPVYANVT
jgi:hypothetical protein